MTYPQTRVATILDVFEVDPERKGGDFCHFEGVFWSPWQDEKQVVIDMPNPSLNYLMASRFMGNMKHVQVDSPIFLQLILQLLPQIRLATA